MSRVRVLIIDDSAVVRKILRDTLESDPRIEVVDTAMDPVFAIEKIKKLRPDVLTLDVEMPRMDGVSFLEKLMSAMPTPVVMVSSLVEKNAVVTLRALELGAFDYVLKPNDLNDLVQMKEVLADKVVAAAASGVKEKLVKIHRPVPPASAMPASAANWLAKSVDTTEKVIAVGSSTGGTVAIERLLAGFSANTPGIVIVQHMPPVFTKSFADRLNATFPLEVREAKDGDWIVRGTVLIAPGDRHMRVESSGARYLVRLSDEPHVNRHRPSVEVLFQSVAKAVGRNALGIMLTGMGDDGAKAMREMKDAGSYNFAQDEASCVVFGMPKKAIENGAVDEILPVESIAPALLRQLHGKS